MLNRDQACRSILDQGMILGLPWGSDPIGDSGPRVDDDGEERSPLPDEGEGDGSRDMREQEEIGGN